MLFFNLSGFTTVDYQTVIVKKLFTRIDVAQSFQEYASAGLIGFQIGITGMINPSSGITLVLGIDDMAIVQMEVEGMVGLAGVMGMPD